MIKLKDELLPQLKRNKTLNAKLQLALDKSWFQINRYFDSNNIVLTSATALLLIEEETGLTTNDLLEQ
jgi:hypothetical protein